MTPVHLTTSELEAALDRIRAAPDDDGLLDMIVRRPRVGEREVLERGELDLAAGLLGDTWHVRAAPGSSGPDPDAQLTIMSSRVAALVAGERSRWPLAGDQLYVDLDLSVENLPPGTRLSIGSAIVEATPPPHTGCRKFVSRFGLDAMKFVNSPLGRRLQLRGINAKVVRPGPIQVGDAVRKMR